MLKKINISLIGCSLFFSQFAFADCNNSPTVSNAAGILSGNTVCHGSTGAWQAQEYHDGASSGNVIDWKQGPNDSVDETSVVGSWNASGSSVTYTYDQGYTFTVKSDATNLQSSTPSPSGGEILFFCGPSNLSATLKLGQVAC